MLIAGRIIRSMNTGVITGSSTSSLSLTGINTAAYSGNSDLYFDPYDIVLQNLNIAAHAFTLHTPLNITAGKTPGQVQGNSDTLNTGDLLTLKSDAPGSAMVASSAGKIIGNVTLERYIPARRAWRLMCAPVAANGAPTINASWQEGAAGSTDNPNPGYSTHITYGLTCDGFDQNPQKTFSMYYYNVSKWSGIPATNKTTVTKVE